MAVFKKSLFIVFAFVLALASFIFIPQNQMQTTYATSEDISSTYNYDDSEIIGTNNSLVSSSIDSVEYVEVDCAPLIKITFTNNFTGSGDNWYSFALLYDKSAYGNSSKYGNKFIFNINDNPFLYNFNMNFGIQTTTANAIRYDDMQWKTQTYNGTTYYGCGIYLKGGVTYDLYLTNLTINMTNTGFTFSKNEYTPLFSKQVVDNTNYLVDFDSETNFTIDFELEDLTRDFITNPLAPKFKTFYMDMYERLKLYVNANVSNFDFGWLACGYSNSVGAGIISTKYYYGTVEAWLRSSPSFNNVSFSFYQDDYNVLTTKANWTCLVSFGVNSFDLTAYDSSKSYIGSLSDNILYVDNLYVSIRRPAKRVNNSLMIYNFDYNGMLSSVNKATYQLRLNNDYYNVNYIGSIPNTKYMVINNDNVNNIVFDEYVLLHFDYNNNLISTPIDYSSMFTLKFGFDFNFTYYTEPLILNNGSYSYEFEKPAYKDGSITFSMTPPKLYIPIEAWVYNAVIFLCFYCPMVSDILGLLKINYFINSLMTVFTLFTGSAIGQFVNACICFLLFWGIMKSLLPSMGGAFSSGAKQTINSINVIKEESKRHIPKKAEFKVKKYGMLKTSQRRKLRSRFNGYKKGTRKSVVNKHGYNQRVYTKKDFDSHYSKIDLDDV